MEMTATANKKSICIPVKGLTIGTAVELHFGNENESCNAYTRLKAMGVKCYHAGKNSPTGPIIMLYACDKNDVKFEISE
jgi:hypothetical protein